MNLLSPLTFFIPIDKIIMGFYLDWDEPWLIIFEFWTPFRWFIMQPICLIFGCKLEHGWTQAW